MRKLTFWFLLAAVIMQNAVNISPDMGDAPGTTLISTLLESFGRLFTIPMAAVWFLGLCSSGKLRRPSAFLVSMFFFIIWGMATYFWSLDPPSTVERITRYIPFALTAYIMWDVVRTEEQIDKLLMAYILSGYVISFALIPAYLSGVTFEGGDRYTAMGFDPNDLAFIVTIMIPIAWNQAMFNRRLSKFARSLYYFYPLAAVMAIVLTASRGSVIDAIPCFIYILYTLRNLGGTSKAAILFCVAVAVVFAATSPSIEPQIARLATIKVSAKSDDLSGRPDIWRAVWREYSKRPFFGVGMAAEPEATRRYAIPKDPDTQQGVIAHNVYLEIVAEEGLPGIFCLIATFAVLAMEIKKLPPNVRYGWITALISFAFGISSLALEMRWQFWIFLAVVATATHSRQLRLPLPARRPINMYIPHRVDASVSPTRHLTS